MKKHDFQPLIEALPEQTLDVSHLIPRSTEASLGTEGASRPVVDLTGKRKVLFAVGAGSSGKTTFLRWACEKALATSEVALATCDPVNRELKYYFEGVQSPSGDTAQWLGLFLSWLMKADCSAAIDMGGGDTSLAGLATSTPGLADVLEAAGVVPVLCVLLTPRVADLTALAALDAVGFRPQATLLICNEGRGDRDAFAAVRSHSVYRAALEREAAEVWLPRNYAAAAVEARRIGFAEAAGRSALSVSSEPQASETRGEASPLGLFDRVRVSVWLRDTERAFGGVASWLL